MLQNRFIARFGQKPPKIRAKEGEVNRRTRRKHWEGAGTSQELVLKYNGDILRKV